METVEERTEGFTARARREVTTVWEQLEEHPFVTAMADGSLPPASYQRYVEQNLLYLPQYARAIALATAKSRDDAELSAYSAALANIVDVEIPQNRLLLDRVRELTGDHSPPAREMAAATRNYTSYLLAVAGTAEVASIGALIMPCAWSYGVIARRHLPQVVAHPVYEGWFSFFATDEYHALVATMRERLDHDLAHLDERGMAGALRIFATATDLEKEFWDMAAAGAAI